LEISLGYSDERKRDSKWEDCMDIKPIETKYKGYRFRSRLEARWAVFFDTIGLVWEYELEGYDLGEYGWYLPDFYFPQIDHFGEVKPDHDRKSMDAEILKCGALVQCTKKSCLLLFGVPTHAGLWRLEYSDEGYGWYDEESESIPGLPNVFPVDVAWTDDCYWKSEGRMFVSTGEGGSFPFQFKLESFYDGSIFMQGIESARSARFEHGENGVAA
jgi:hypothetical protein